MRLVVFDVDTGAKRAEDLDLSRQDYIGGWGWAARTLAMPEAVVREAQKSAVGLHWRAPSP